MNTISNATTIAAMMQIQKVCSILSTRMPHADETTDAVRILRRLLGCWCWQWVHAVNVEIVVKRKSVCKHSIVVHRSRQVEEGVSSTSKHSTATTTARNTAVCITVCGSVSQVVYVVYVCDAVHIVWCTAPSVKTHQYIKDEPSSESRFEISKSPESIKFPPIIVLDSRTRVLDCCCGVSNCMSTYRVAVSAKKAVA